MDSDSSPPYNPPPLPNAPPPVIRPQPPQSPPRKSRGWKILAIILLVLLMVSLFSNLGFLSSLVGASVKHTRTVGPKLEEVVLEDKGSARKLAVVDVEGIISSQFVDQGGYSIVELIRAQLKNAHEDSRVKAVVLKVNSPGGEVLASDEIYRAIADFQKESKKPVVASMGSLAASGGYYVSAPCQWIVANELTITGSIGVILHGWNYRGLMNKVGLSPVVYKSGKFKDMLSGSRNPEEIPPEEQAMVQGLIDETFTKFKGVVAEGRAQASRKNKNSGRSLSQDWESYADGRVLSGTEAYRLGFVDELGGFEKAVQRAEALAGLRPDDANLVQYQQRYDLSDIFRLFGQTEARTRVVKVDLGMDVPKLQAGQLYFLSPTFLH